MSATARQSAQRPRELRRRLILPARLRQGASWVETCILNVSSRGLMIHTSQALPIGSLVELSHGRHLVQARVMWRKGPRFGLRCEDRLPVDEMLSLGEAGSLRLVALEGELVESIRRPSRAEMSGRLRGRAIEFVGVVSLMSALGLGGTSWVAKVLGGPLTAVERALDPGAQAAVSR